MPSETARLHSPSVPAVFAKFINKGSSETKKDLSTIIGPRFSRRCLERESRPVNVSQHVGQQEALLPKTSENVMVFGKLPVIPKVLRKILTSSVKIV